MLLSCQCCVHQALFCSGLMYIKFVVAYYLFLLLLLTVLFAISVTCLLLIVIKMLVS